jgi:MFS family permease
MIARFPSVPASPVDTADARQGADEPGRRFGLRDGMFQAVTQGSGEQYLSAFALLWHATPLHLSILSALPQLLGTWAQLVSIKISHWFPTRKSLVFWGIVGQSVSWIPILALPLFWPQFGAWLVIAGAATYFACFHFTAPAWNTLITDLLEDNERGVYFARRARVMAVVSFFALCLSGALLTAFEQRQQLWLGFAILFLAAGLLRGLSTVSLRAVTDHAHPDTVSGQTGFRAFLLTGLSKDFRNFLLFSSLMHVAVLIAGPFFVIYMLRDLHLSYWEYGGWLAAGIVGQFVMLPTWGQVGDRFGNKALLRITGYLVPVLPMLYLLGTAWSFLVAVNFFGGVVWAGLSLGLQNYVFDAVQPTDRAKGVAVASTVNAAGWALGTLIGSWLIGVVPATLGWQSWGLQPASNLPFIFFLSGVLRLLVVASLFRSFKETRPVERYSHGRLLGELPLIRNVSRLCPRLSIRSDR